MTQMDTDEIKEAEGGGRRPCSSSHPCASESSVDGFFFAFEIVGDAGWMTGGDPSASGTGFIAGERPAHVEP
jgi:hypothetical protein